MLKDKVKQALKDAKIQYEITEKESCTIYSFKGHEGGTIEVSETLGFISNDMVTIMFDNIECPLKGTKCFALYICGRAIASLAVV